MDCVSFGPALAPAAAEAWGCYPSHNEGKPFSEGHCWIETADRTQKVLMQISGMWLDPPTTPKATFKFTARLESGELLGTARVHMELNSLGDMRAWLEDISSKGEKLGYKKVGTRLMQAAIEWTLVQGSSLFELRAENDSLCFYSCLGIRAWNDHVDAVIRQYREAGVRLSAEEIYPEDLDAGVRMYMPFKSMVSWRRYICADPIFYRELLPLEGTTFDYQLNRRTVLDRVASALDSTLPSKERSEEMDLS